jgi:hypothetical protein
MANPVPRRDSNRPAFARRGGVISSEEILANIKASGVPDDAAEGESGPAMGIRNDKWLKEHRASGKRVGDE